MPTIQITRAEADAALAQIPAAQADFPCISEDATEYLSGAAADAIRAPRRVRQVIVGDVSGRAAGVWDAPVPVETIRDALLRAASGGYDVTDA